MPKKTQLNKESINNPCLQHLDFTETQKQVDALMKTVCHDNTIHAHKIRFIHEQLQDQRYIINTNIIAQKMFEDWDNSEWTAAEISSEVV